MFSSSNKKGKYSLYTVVLLLLVVCIAGCGRTDYESLLSTNALSRFYFGSDSNILFALDVDADIESKQLSAIVPYGTDLTTLVPSYNIDGYAFFVDGVRQSSGESIQDFTSAKTYSLYSLDGRRVNYTISVVESQAYFTSFAFLKNLNVKLTSACNASVVGNAVWFYIPQSISLAKLTPDFVSYLDGQVTYDGISVFSDTRAYDFRSPLVFRVYEAGESDNPVYMDYQVSAYRLTELTFGADDNGFESDYSAYLEDDTITVELPYDANVSALVPTYTFLGNSVTFDGVQVKSGSGTVDFSSPVAVCVSTDSGLSHIYTVQVNLEAAPQNDQNDPELADGSGTESGYTGDTAVYSLGYNLNGGSGILPDTVSYGAGASVTLFSGDITNTGLVFGGWNTAADGSGTDYEAGVAFTMPAHDVIMYAHWGPEVSGITLDRTSYQKAGVETFTLTATVLPADAANPSLSWTSSDTSVATVSDGIVTTSGTVGTATITATSTDGSNVSATCDVTILSTQISSVTDLENIQYDLADDYTLESDLDLSNDSDWQPIGSESSPFTGTFDGNGYTIDGLTQTTTRMKNCALFGSVGAAGTLKNVVLTNVDVEGYDAVGGLVGRNNGTIENCSTGGSITIYYNGSTDTFGAGGLAGKNYGSSALISYCSSSCTISADTSSTYPHDLGGLVGNNGDNGGTIEYSFATGSINCPLISNIGGLVGNSGSGHINNSYATGDVTGDDSVGGLVGYGCTSSTYGTTGMCYAVGSVTAGSNGGELYGYAYYSANITDSFYLDQSIGSSGTACDSATLQSEGTYTAVSWDFTNIWSISSAINDGYPYLKRETPTDSLVTDFTSGYTDVDMDYGSTGATGHNDNSDGSAYSFDGSSSYVDFTSDVPTYSYDDSFSISLWFNADSLGTVGDNSRLISNCNGMSHGHFVYYVCINDTATGLSAGIGQNGIGGSTAGVSIAPVSIATWYHAVMTYDGSTVCLYIDGELTGSDTYTAGSCEDGGTLRIGAGSGGTGHYFEGTIDDVRIYSKALSAGEVLQLYYE